MHFYPDSWGSDLLEHNTCHGPADGKFCSGAGAGGRGRTGGAPPDPKDTVGRLYDRAKGLNRIPHEDYQPVTITDDPRKTKLLLPDGTRLAGRGEHSDLVFESLKSERGGMPPRIGEVLAAGTVRYSAGKYGGVELKAPLTSQQAQAIADDWNYTYEGELSIDMTPAAPLNYDRYESRKWPTPIHAGALRVWSQKAFEKLNTTQ